MRIRNIVSVKYCLELLMQTDDFLAKKNEELFKITQLKIPLINYIYYSCLESERIADDIYKCAGDFTSLVQFEIKRMETLKDFTISYKNYFFTYFLKLTVSILKVFLKDLKSSGNSVSVTHHS